MQNRDRRSDDRHTDRQMTDASDLIICPMLCYGNGTDNYNYLNVKVHFTK